MATVFLLPTGATATALGGTDNGLFSIDPASGVISRTGTLSSGTTYNIAYLVYDTVTGGIVGQRDTITTTGAVTPPAMAMALPSSAGTPVALYSVTQPTGYSGPCLRLVRVSDNAQQDIGFNSSGSVDSAAALTWANGSAMKITTVYDLSGSGNHATQTTLANMPDFSSENALNGNWPITFNGSTAGGFASQFLAMPTTVAANRTNVSIFMGVNPTVSRQANCYLELPVTPAGNGTSINLFTYGGYFGLCCNRPGGTYQSQLAPRSQPNAFGVVSSSTAHVFYVQGKTASFGAAISGTMAGGNIGKSTDYGGQMNLRSDVFSIVIYATALSSSDGAAVITAINNAHGFPTTFTSRVILDGDSILEGILLNGSAGTSNSLQNWVRQMTGLKGTPEIYNMGIAGQTQIGCVSSFTNKINTLISDTTLPVIVGFEAGTNDLNSAQNNTALKAAAGDYVKAARAVKPSAKVIGQTLLPRSTTVNPLYTDYNTYIRGLTLTATDGTTYTLDGVADAAADPVMGSNANTANTTLYGDFTHPVKFGDSYIAPIWRDALNALLP